MKITKFNNFVIKANKFGIELMRVFISFDFDRTLADYSRAHGNSILGGIYDTYGIHVNWMDIRSSGLMDSQIITYLVHNHGISFDTIYKNMNKVIKTTNHKFHKYLSFYPIELLDKTEETLRSLSKREDVFLGISTGNIKSICLSKTKYSGIDHFFTFGSFGDEVYHRNQLLRLTKERLVAEYNFTSDDIAFHVGDSILDMSSAKLNGFIPIGITTGHYSGDELFKAGAKFVFNKLPEFSNEFDDLLEIIGQKDQKLPEMLKVDYKV